jgi:Chromo (CHRromatin Organisation MOdifier) domain
MRNNETCAQTIQTLQSNHQSIKCWLQDLITHDLENPWHIPCIAPNFLQWKTAHSPNFLKPPPDLIEGKPEWEAEIILEDRIYKKKKQYLIQWKGYAPAHDSWEDESGIHAPDLIAKHKLRKLWDQSAP